MAPTVRPGSLIELAALAALVVLAAVRGVAPVADRTAAAAWLLLGLALCGLVVARRSDRIGLVLAVGLGILALLRPDQPANAWAGSLAVALPFWWGLADDQGPRLRLAAVWLLVLASIGGLVTAGSRGGLVAAVLGLAAAWLAATRRPARTAAALIAGATLLAAAGTWLEKDGEPLWRQWLLENSAHGLSLDTALSGRPAIWKRSLWALEDSPLTGLGPAGFAAGLPCAYPGGPDVDHAHQALLQAAHDLGLPGALLLFWLGLRAFAGLLRVRRQGGTSQRRLAAGLLGALVAYTVFGLADCLALGTPTGLLLWPMLGLGLRHAPSSAPVLTAMPGLLAALVPIPGEVAAKAAIVAVCRPSEADSSLARRLAQDSTSHPRLHWLLGRLHEESGDLDARDAAWRRLIDASPDRLELVAVRSLHPAASREATERWPQEADAWRWHSRNLESLDPRSAIAGWRRVVDLAPRDGHAWLHLADLLAEEEPAVALEAYAVACLNGDPGANACGRGGRLAEKHGALLRAAALYRRSRWPPIRARADQLLPSPSPPP